MTGNTSAVRRLYFGVEIEKFHKRQNQEEKIKKYIKLKACGRIYWPACETATVNIHLTPQVATHLFMQDFKDSKCCGKVTL